VGFLAVPLLVILKRALLIANPASRRGGQYVDVAYAAIRAAGVECDAVITERTGHARELSAARAHEYDVVFTLGGDGTAMEVAGALAHSGIPIAVLPGGTGNLLSRALGVPRRVKKAVPALLNGTVRQIDLGSLLGHHFAVAAGVGIDASMVADTPLSMKRRFGVLAYTMTAVKAGLHAVLWRRFFTVRVDTGTEVIERKAVAVLFANFGSILEGRISFGPDIHADDGLLDCCIVSPKNLLDAVRVMWRVTRGDFGADSALLYRKGERFRVETQPVLPVQADGELLGVTPVEIRVEPLAAHLLVPRS
jgi:YegS/Rv2252/BmrU family lipid kinase